MFRTFKTHLAIYFWVLPHNSVLWDRLTKCLPNKIIPLFCQHASDSQHLWSYCWKPWKCEKKIVDRVKQFYFIRYIIWFFSLSYAKSPTAMEPSTSVTALPGSTHPSHRPPAPQHDLRFGRRFVVHLISLLLLVWKNERKLILPCCLCIRLCLSICLCVHLLVCPSVCPSACVSVCVCPYVYPVNFFRLMISSCCLCIRLCVCPCICVSPLTF
jgi:hypothetical protein